MHLIYCPDCGANQQQQVTCNNCGFELPTPCPACAQLNTAGNRYCTECGKTLLHSPAQNPEGLHERAERRQLTVMFCDLVGSTALSQHLDPEDLREVIHAFQKQCTDAITFFDGYIARYMGDGVLAYFGYPHAHELDSERAVRSALEIIQRTQAINVMGDRPLQVRIGIETGLVVAGDIIGSGESQEHTVLGDTPNMAARLQGVATPGTVVIGPGTYNIIKRRFSVVELGLQTLKGIVQPVPVYRVTSASDQQQHQTLSPIFGRQREIASIACALDSAQTGAVVVIEGNSGLGKTRLLKQVLHSVSGDYERVVLRCSPFYTDRPLYPIIRHWHALLDLPENDSQQQHLERLIRFLRARGISDTRLHALISATIFPSAPLATELTGSAAELRSAKLKAFVETVMLFSDKKPMLLAVEDSHWIDSSTVEFLSLLMQRNHLRVAIVMTSRTPLSWLTAETITLTRIQLEPLSESAMSDLVHSIAGAQKIPAGTQREILIKADGSPLYAEELTKAVLELGDDSNAPIQVPSSLQDSLRSRLDRLGSARDVAQFVAVLGRNFSHRLIQACTPYALAATDKALDALVTAELLVIKNSGDRKGYAFRHMMVQEVAYNSLLHTTRKDHHQRIARAIQKHFPDMVENSPEVLASHFELGDQIDDAIQYWQLAGEHASSTWAHAEAINHLSRALQLLESSEQTASRSALELSLRIASVRSLRILEKGDAALQQLSIAESIARESNCEADLAVIHNLHGNILFSKGDIAGCMENHRAAIEWARRAQSPVDEIQAISGLGDANLLKGMVATAEKSYADCLDLCQSAELQGFIPPNLSLRGHMRLYLNQLETSEQDIVEAIRLAQTSNDRRTEMVAKGSCLAKTLCERGQYLRAREALNEALATARDVSALRFEALYLLFLVRVHYLMDRSGEPQDINFGLALANQSIEVARQTGFRYVGAIAFGAKALLVSSKKERQSVLREGEQLLTPGAPSQNYLWFLRDAIEVSLLDRDPKQAAHFAQMLKSYTQQQPLPWSDIYIDMANIFTSDQHSTINGQQQESITNLRQNCQQAGLVAALQLLDQLTTATYQASE